VVTRLYTSAAVSLEKHYDISILYVSFAFLKRLRFRVYLTTYIHSRIFEEGKTSGYDGANADMMNIQVINIYCR